MSAATLPPKVPESLKKGLPRYADGGTTGGDRLAFIKTYAPLAQKWSAQTGIPASVFLAIAASESNFGNTPGYALFGLVGVDGTAGSQMLRTETGMQKFPAYKTPDDAFAAFVRTVQQPRYAQAWANRTDPTRFVTGLQAGGYSGDKTDSDRTWANKIILNGTLPAVQSAARQVGISLDSGGAAAPATAQRRSPYVFPVAGYRGKVENHWGEVHGGSDIFATEGTPVMAMRGGRVVSAGFGSVGGSVGGNNVTIQGDDGLTYYYAHMKDAPSVKAGDVVGAGQQIGAVGRTGNADKTGPHLHIGIGPSIVNGADKYGGTGGDFDAVTMLSSALNGDDFAITPDKRVVIKARGVYAKDAGAFAPSTPAGQAGYRTNVDPALLTRYNTAVIQMTNGLARLADLQAKEANGGLTQSEQFELMQLPSQITAAKAVVDVLQPMVKPGQTESPAQQALAASQTAQNYASAAAATAGIGTAAQNAAANAQNAASTYAGTMAGIVKGMGDLIHTGFADDAVAAEYMRNVVNDAFNQAKGRYDAALQKGQLDLNGYAAVVTATATAQAAEAAYALQALKNANYISDENWKRAQMLLPAGTHYQPGFAPNSPMNQALKQLGLGQMVIETTPLPEGWNDPEANLTKGAWANERMGYANPAQAFTGPIAGLQGTVDVNKAMPALSFAPPAGFNLQPLTPRNYDDVMAQYKDVVAQFTGGAYIPTVPAPSVMPTGAVPGGPDSTDVEGAAGAPAPPVAAPSAPPLGGGTSPIENQAERQEPTRLPISPSRTPVNQRGTRGRFP